MVDSEYLLVVNIVQTQFKNLVHGRYPNIFIINFEHVVAYSCFQGICI